MLPSLTIPTVQGAMASTKELVRMQLGYYKPAACLELGKVTIGHQTTADLVLENDEDVEVLVLVTKISNKFKQDIKLAT